MVTAATPVLPVTPEVGPVAVSVQSSTTEVPPKVFETVLTRVRCVSGMSMTTVGAMPCPALLALTVTGPNTAAEPVGNR